MLIICDFHKTVCGIFLVDTWGFVVMPNSKQYVRANVNFPEGSPLGKGISYVVSYWEQG